MFTSPIKRIAVIGSGVMGSQIAAHISNAGVPVVLLDIVPKGAQDRDVLASTALAKMRKDMSVFMHPDNAKLITPGNLEDDLGILSEIDWIIEAVLEDQQIKSDVYKEIDAVRKAGSIVSSNTSTIPLARLIQGQSEKFAHDFMITHFYNPPRTMRLIELMAGETTCPDAIKSVTDFCDHVLGKGVVRSKAAPGFIANRLGIFFLQCGMNSAFDLGLTVEEADAVFGKPLGMPKTGMFGLIDLIGLDLISLSAKSLLSTLSEDDAYRAINIPRALIDKMISEGYTGRKGKGGFYRVQKMEVGKVTEALDLKTGKYRVSKEGKPKSIEEAKGNLRVLCEAQDSIGKFAWFVLSHTLVYAASLVPQSADDIVAIDTAMRLGFNWEFGPFELIDKLGVGWFVGKLKAEGRVVPELLKKAEDKSFYKVENGKQEFLTAEGKYNPIVRSEGILLLADIKLASTPVLKNASASVWDVGDGVLCFEFTTKMNTLDVDTLALLRETIALIENNGGKYKGLVFYNDSNLFSAGANLRKGLQVTDDASYAVTRQIIRQGQKTYHALRFARFPSVSAPAGLALGGACELTMHCSAAQAYAETYLSLVEVLIGEVPGWGGCAQMLGRAFQKYSSGDTLTPVRKTFEIISQARRSRSAFEARDLMYLRETDGITMNRDRLLFDAKQRLLQMVKDYEPPLPLKLNLPGSTEYAFFESMIDSWRALGKALSHDATVAKALAAVLCGIRFSPRRPVTEAQMLGLEQREFMKLARMPQTAARIRYMLETGQPLRN
ncbi:MAG: 3-hydroxyacyl-CoA dehydrogenase NAD-binding domain-containing protein [Bdellovibrionales bacterium]